MHVTASDTPTKEKVALPFYSKTLDREVDRALLDSILAGQYHHYSEEDQARVLGEFCRVNGWAYQRGAQVLDEWIEACVPADSLEKARRAIQSAFAEAYGPRYCNGSKNDWDWVMSQPAIDPREMRATIEATAKTVGSSSAPLAEKSRPENGIKPASPKQEPIASKAQDSSDYNSILATVLPTLADVARTYKKLDYFWYPWIPYSELTVINGDGGVGKSYLNCAVIAHRAMGLPLPGDDQAYPPTRSLIINNEDHNDRILERFSSLTFPVDLKTDLIRLWPEEWKPFRITEQEHIVRLEKLIKECRIGAVWLDSLESMLPGVDINKDSEVVPKARALVSVAQSHGIPIVVNHHTNATVGVKATQRSRGSKQIINICRSALIIEKLYEGDSPDPTLRAMSHSKVNYAPEAPTQAFHISPLPDRKASFRFGEVRKDINADQLANQKINSGDGTLTDNHLRVLEYLVETAECAWVRLNVISKQLSTIPKSHLSGRFLKLLREKYEFVEWREGGEYRASAQGRKYVRGE